MARAAGWPGGIPGRAGAPSRVLGVRALQQRVPRDRLTRKPVGHVLIGRQCRLIEFKFVVTHILSVLSATVV